MTVLTLTTGLSCILMVNIGITLNCFLIRNLRSTDICFYLEFTKQSVYNDFKVKFSHSGNNCLTCFFISISSECRVFFCKLCKSNTHFFLTSLCLWLDSQLNNRFREFHRFKNYGVLFVTKRIACSCIFKTNSCGNITCIYCFNVFSVV